MITPTPAPSVIEFEPDVGVIRLTRAHLGLLVHPPFIESPQVAAGLRAELETVGVIGPGGTHAALDGVVAVLSRTRSRFLIRQWRSRGRRTVEGLVGPRGIVVLPGGTDPHAHQDVRFHPHPAALARVVAGLLGLAPTIGDPPLPGEALAWDEVLALTRKPPPWITRSLGSGNDVSVYDLVWQARPDGAQGSVLVLVDLGRAGLATVEAVDRDHPGDGYRLVARRPEQIWFGLCRLARPSPDRRHPQAMPARR